MPLKTSVRRKLMRKTEILEGRVSHLYADSEGIITIGIGHRVANESEVKKLPLYEKKRVGHVVPLYMPATIQQKVDEFKAIKSQIPNKPWKKKASYYKQFCKLMMLDGDIERQFDNHISSFYRELTWIYNTRKGYSKHFDKFPDEVQLALFDMIFNLGMTQLRTTWPKISAAIKQENWQVAAKESHRPSVNATRNKYVFNLFMAAHKAQQQAKAKTP